MPVRACIGLGGNLGDPARALRAAFHALAALPDSRLLATSRLYRTPAWGRTDQPDYVNAAALLETRLAPQVLLAQLLAIERAAGRLRDGEAAAARWGPRVLDLDLLLYADITIDQPGLRVPHPHLHERAFALLPLLEAWPAAIIPGIGPARECAGVMAADGIEPLP